MPQGVRLPKDQLLARYRISERLAARVGALLAKGVELTGALLETAPPSSPAEALLLHPDVLARADRLEAADLTAIGRGVPGGESVPPLAVTVSDDRRVVALEEEILAESVWPETGTKGGTLREVPPASLLAGGGPQGLGTGASGETLRPEEAQGLFTPDALARIKLTILTGVDPSAKIEALRKLGLAPMELEEKGRLCLKALAEEHPGVRREAALLLRTLGIAPEVSETIAGLSEGEPGARKLAMTHVAALQARVTPAEQFILLAVLLAVIREEKNPALATAALEALAAFAPRIASDGELLDRALRLLYPLLAGEAPLAAPASVVLTALGRANPGATAEALHQEIRTATDVPLRRRLLATGARLETGHASAGGNGSAGRRRTLADAIARELGTGPDSDPLCRQLAVEAIALGMDATEALMEAFPGAQTEQRPFLIKVLDDVATADASPAAARPAVGTFFLRTWRAAGRILRLALLSTRLPLDAALPADLRREFARCFLADLHDAGFPHVADATEEAIRRMGMDVLPAVRDIIRESVHAIERETAARLYATILRDAQDRPGADGGEAALPLAEAVAFLRSLEDGSLCSPGAAARAMGILLSGPLAPPDLVAEMTADYRRRLIRTTAAEDMVCALGWIASGPRLAAPQRLDLLVLLVDLLLRAAPNAPVTQSRTDEGIRIEFSAEASRQTDFIRELILAVRRIVCSDSARTTLPPGLRERAARRLLDKWAQVANYDVVWSPGNVTDLAEALGATAVSPGLPVPLRSDIVAGLREAARSIPIIRVVGLACTWEDDPADGAAAEDLAAFGIRCREVGEQFADMLQHADYSDPEDQDVLLEAIGRIAGAARLGATPADDKSMRSRLLACLFDGLSHGRRRAREALGRLVDSPHLPDTLRRSIRERFAGEQKGGF